MIHFALNYNNPQHKVGLDWISFCQLFWDRQKDWTSLFFILVLELINILSTLKLIAFFGLVLMNYCLFLVDFCKEQMTESFINAHLLLCSKCNFWTAFLFGWIFFLREIDRLLLIWMKWIGEIDRLFSRSI